MKIKRLLIGMLACSAMVACTNEDVIDNPNDNPVKNGKKYYAAVNLAMPGSSSSRATSHIGFANGDAEENKINNATFFFLDANGKSCADAYYVADKISSTNYTQDETDVLGSFDQKTSTLIVMENPTEVPSSIVVLINVGDITGGTTPALNERASLTDIQGIAQNYATETWNAMPENGMVMSNSTYVDAAGDVIVGAPVGIENIIIDGDYEVGNVYDGNVEPVTIYVEKVLAKVTVTNEIGENTEDLNGYSYTTVDENGATVSATETFKVEIKNWWLDSTPTKSNLLKSIENYSYTWEWNSISNYRSYWANSYAVEGQQTYVNNFYNSGVASGESLYCQENTSQATKVDTQVEDANDNTYDANNRTKVVVAATLIDSDGNEANMVKWYGKLYSKDAFIITLANLNDVKKYYIKTTSDDATTYTSLTKENLELVWNTDEEDVAAGEIDGENQSNETVGTEVLRNYEAVVTLTEDTPKSLWIQSNGEWTEVSKEDADEAIRSISKVLYWNAGSTYYYVELEHITGYYGVVRNHLYQVNLTGLKGLGTPVPDPDKIIIPERPGESDMDTYISANMIIQAYRVVSQDVTLQ